jgi:hypothetical protein
MKAAKDVLRRRSHQTGAAMVEAVIAMPLFIVVFVSVLYVRDLVLVHQRSKSEARSCAWLYSAKSCDEVPPGCAGALSIHDAVTTEEEELSSGVTQGLSDVPDPAGGGVNGLIEPAIRAAFGRGVTATVRREVSRPRIFGGGKGEVIARYELACNLAHSTPEQVAADAWDLFGF